MAGPSVSLVPTVSDPANIKIWADIGVIFLLFRDGTGLFVQEIDKCGHYGYRCHCHYCMWHDVHRLYSGECNGVLPHEQYFSGGMLSMSSTAIVFKAFNDMGLLQQKFTGIVLGILVIEDLVAVVMMVVLSTLAVGKHFEGKEMLESILKAAAFLIFWSALGIYLIPTLREDTPFHQQRDFIDNLSGTLPGNGDDCDKSGIFCRIGEPLSWGHCWQRPLSGKNRTYRTAGKRPVRFHIFRVGRNDDRSCHDVGICRPYSHPDIAGTVRSGTVRELWCLAFRPAVENCHTVRLFTDTGQ